MKTDIEWTALQELSFRLSAPGVDPGSIPELEWKIIAHTLSELLTRKDWNGVLQLRRTFTDLYANDSMTGLPVLQQLDQDAITAARSLGRMADLAHLLGAKGHNLHRQGFHTQALEAFEESANSYRIAGNERQALENFYMTSLCHRALGDRERARQVLQDVLEQTSSNDPWRAHPLQVLAWLSQDSGNLPAAEALLRQALSLFRILPKSDLLIAGALADLGEIVGILGRFQEARLLFEESLALFPAHKGQFNRQEARAALKYSELLMQHGQYTVVEQLLNQADDKISRYGHYYDLLWQIELARAFVFLRTGRFRFCLFKLRSVFRIRRLLGLSNILLVQYVSKRYLQRLFHSMKRFFRLQIEKSR
jgi:tetratricopeptide (TPR) repeat protein